VLRVRRSVVSVCGELGLVVCCLVSFYAAMAWRPSDGELDISFCYEVFNQVLSIVTTNLNTASPMYSSLQRKRLQ
jgi:hypothetical protein